MRNVRGASSGDFNPLPRKEGDSQFKSFLDCEAHFNPLPRKEGDNHSGKRNCDARHFNPLPRKEGDDVVLSISIRLLAISIHSLVKRETLALLHLPETPAFQSTPS